MFSEPPHQGFNIGQVEQNLGSGLGSGAADLVVVKMRNTGSRNWDSPYAVMRYHS